MSLSSFLQQAVWPVLAIWVAAELAMMLSRKATFSSGHWCNGLVGASFLLYLGIAYLLDRFEVGRIGRVESWAPEVGAVLFALGITLRAVAIAKMGRTFSPNLESRRGQPLITTGIYGTVRHPAYLGSLTAYLAIALMFANWILLCVAAVLFPALYAWRIRMEDQELSRLHGDEYDRYRRSVPGVLPLQWPRSGHNSSR